MPLTRVWTEKEGGVGRGEVSRGFKRGVSDMRAIWVFLFAFT